MQLHSTKSATASTLPESALVLSKAVVRAANALELSQSRLGKVLGLSPATVSRLVAGTYQLSPSKKEWELGLLFTRLFRSLDSIVGTATAARTWLHGRNLAFDAAPAELIVEISGLVRVVEYLDAHRGRL